MLRKEWATEFDVLIVDTPAAADAADAQTVAACAGGAMIVVRKNASRVGRVRGLAENAALTGAAIVGTVLTEF